MNDDDHSRLLGIVVPTLGAPEFATPTEEDRRISKVALEWQRFSLEARWMEVHAMLAGLPRGTYIELFGRCAVMGEQLGLALASLLDARGWITRPTDLSHRVLSTLASAEIAGYFALSTAHGLAVVTARALRINPAAHRVLQRAKAGEPDPPWFTPFDSTHQPTMSESWVSQLTNAADATAEPAAQAIVEPLKKLLADPMWAAMVERRHKNFHRDRPQSLESGVAFEDPWEHGAYGQGMLSIPGSSRYTPPSAELAVAEASAAIGQLAISMTAWSSGIRQALVALGGTQRWSDEIE